jgi:hypothetical protein
VVEGARLESVYTATYRGFESLLNRHPKQKASHKRGFLLWVVWIRTRPEGSTKTQDSVFEQRSWAEPERQGCRELIPPQPPSKSKSLAQAGLFVGALSQMRRLASSRPLQDRSNNSASTIATFSRSLQHKAYSNKKGSLGSLHSTSFFTVERCGKRAEHHQDLLACLRTYQTTPDLLR